MPKQFPLSGGLAVLGNLGRKTQQPPATREVTQTQPSVRTTQELKITPDIKQGSILDGLKQALSAIQLPQFGTRAQPKTEQIPVLVTEDTESKSVPAPTRSNPIAALANLVGSRAPRRAAKIEQPAQEAEKKSETIWHPTQSATYQNFAQALGELQQRHSQPLDIGQYLLDFRDSQYQDLGKLHQLVQHLSGQEMDVVTPQDYASINDLFEAYESEWVDNIAAYNQPKLEQPKTSWNPLASLQALKLPRINLNARSWFGKKESTVPEANPVIDPAPIAKASLVAGIAGIWASVSNTLTAPRKPKNPETPKISVAEYIDQLNLVQGSRIYVDYVKPTDITDDTTTVLEVIQIKDDSSVMARDVDGKVIHIEPINILGKGVDNQALGTLPTRDVIWINNPDLVANKPKSLSERSILLQLQAMDFLKRYRWAIGGGVALAAVIAYLVTQDHNTSNNIASAVNTTTATPTNPVAQLPQVGLPTFPEIKIPQFSIPTLPTLPEEISRLNPSDILNINIPTTPLVPAGIEQTIANNLSNLGAQVVEVGQRIWHDAGVSHTGLHMDINPANIKLHVDPALLSHMQSTLGSTDTAQILINFADGTNQVVSVPLTGGDVILDSTTQAYKAIASNTASHFEFGKLANGVWNIFSSFKR
jgi:hypothetical protein